MPFQALIDRIIGKAKEKLDASVADDFRQLPVSNYVVFDIETTGLSHTENRIIEIAADEYKNGRLIEHFHTYVNPGCHIPITITRLTGISDTDVADAPSIREVKKQFLAFIGRKPLVGHNISTFDIPFLRAHMNVTFKNPVYDTLSISRQSFPDLPSYKLSYLDRALHLGGLELHRASNDITVTNALFLACFNSKKYQNLLTDKEALASIHVEARRPLFSDVKVHDIVPSEKAATGTTGLTGKAICFTGEISISRVEAYQLAVDAGAVLKSCVSNKVDYLVVGEQDSRLVGKTGTSNAQRHAAELIEKGNQNLQIIDEARFLELLKEI